MAFRVQIRRDTSGKWIVNNPVLLSGEFGYETDTTHMKIGDGATPWNYLPYWTGANGTPGATGATGSSDIYSLPSPKINLTRIAAYGATGATSCYMDSRITVSDSGVIGGTGPKFVMTNFPIITTMNVTQTQIDAGVWVEMVYYRSARGRKNTAGEYVTEKGFKIMTSKVDGINTLTEEIINLYPEYTPKFRTRGGTHRDINMNIYNHFRVESSSQSISVIQYFNGLFSYSSVAYNETLSYGNYPDATCLIPAMRSTQWHGFGRRFGYEGRYKPLYVKFRYIMWNPQANENAGDFVVGPFSETVKIASPVQPFLVDFNQSVLTGESKVTLNPEYHEGDGNQRLRCWIEANTP